MGGGEIALGSRDFEMKKRMSEKMTERPDVVPKRK